MREQVFLFAKPFGENEIYSYVWLKLYPGEV